MFRELGYDGPWGVEVLSEELRNLPIEQIFDRAYETTSAQLAHEIAVGSTEEERRPFAGAERKSLSRTAFRDRLTGCSPRCCASASSRSA